MPVILDEEAPPKVIFDEEPPKVIFDEEPDSFRPSMGERSLKEIQPTPSLKADILPPGADRRPQRLPGPTALQAGPVAAIEQQRQAEVAAIPEMTGDEIKQSLIDLATQGVPIPTIPTVGEDGVLGNGLARDVANFGVGAANTIGGVATFATSPLGIGLAGAAQIPGVGPALTGYFLGDVTAAAAEKAGESSVTKNPETIGEATTLGLMAGGLGKHLYKSAAEFNQPGRRLATELNKATREGEPIGTTKVETVNPITRLQPNLLPLTSRVMEESKGSLELGRIASEQQQAATASRAKTADEMQREVGRVLEEASATKPPTPRDEPKSDTVQDAPSVGAAAKSGSGEFDQGTALKNASGELERALHFDEGTVEPYRKEVQAMLPAWERSAETLVKDPMAGEKLAGELKYNPERGLTGDESALLLRHKQSLQNAKNQAAEDSMRASTPEAKAEAEARFDKTSNDLLDLLDTVKFRGSQWGREGRWRQAMAFEDYSLETMRRDKRMAVDRPLTPFEEAHIKQLNERITELETQLRDKESTDTKVHRETSLDESIKEVGERVESESRQDKAAGTERDLTGEKKDVIDHLKERFKDQEGSLEGGNASIRKLMELLWLDGVRERAAMEKAIHDILTKQVDPTITLTETQDLMSNYGKNKPFSKEPVKIGVAQIVGEIQSVRKLLDFWQGKAPAKTGNERVVPSQTKRLLDKVVNEAKKRFGTIATDPAKALQSALASVETRLKNRLSDLKQEVATRKKIIKERAPTPYNEETLRLQKEIEAVKKEWDEIFGKPELTPEQRLKRAEDSALRQEGELKRQLRTGEIFPKGKITSEQRSAILDATKARIEALKEERQWAREAAQPKPEVADAEAARRSTSLDKQIAEIERQLKMEEVGGKGRKPKGEETPENKARLDKLKALKEERENMRERLFQPTEEPEVRQLRQILDRYRKLEVSYRDRLARGDFSKRVQKEQPTSEATLAAKVKVEDAKQDFMKGLHEDRLARRSTGQKIRDGIKQTGRAYGSIMASADFSAPRQALGFILRIPAAAITNPIGTIRITARAFGRMFQATFSEHQAKLAEQRRLSRPNAKSGLDKLAGIDYTDLNATKFTRYEENARSILDEWAQLPLSTDKPLKTVATLGPKLLSRVVHGSNRGFTTFLNTARSGLADELFSTQFKNRPPTAVEARDVGYLVNLVTGRGELSPTTAKVGGYVLWSPNLMASRMKLMAGTPFTHAGSAKTKLIVTREYANMLMGGLLLWKTSRMFNDPEKKESAITSSSAGKIIRGNVFIDPWGGFQQVTVLGARGITGDKTTLKEKTQKLGEGYGVPTMWYVGADFLRSKLRPELGLGVNLVTRKDFLGRNTDITTAEGAERLAKSAVPIPLAWGDIKSIMREQGFTEAMILEAISLFGVGVTIHEEQSKQK